jgi:UDP-N-acetylglucosamine 2-epimerase (non-hydrolysing)
VPDDPPRCVLVVGDVNSTLACSIVAKKLQMPGGARGGRPAQRRPRMPEEINRLVTDSISDWFFVTEPSRRGAPAPRRQAKDAVHYVGHVMVDNLLYQADKLAAPTQRLETSASRRTYPRYGVVTLHRPSNVDDPAMMRGIVGALRRSRRSCR